MSERNCAYCGCDVTVHDPVFVREWDGGVGERGGSEDGDSEETPFCNYGCLAAHIEDEKLAVGTSCSVER